KTLMVVGQELFLDIDLVIATGSQKESLLKNTEALRQGLNLCYQFKENLHLYREEIMIEKIKKIREITNLSLNECKKALEKTGGSIDDALILLQGVQTEKYQKRKNKTASEGRIEAYIHTGSQLACIVEVNCETDFAARSNDFIKFCEVVAMQIVAMHP